MKLFKRKKQSTAPLVVADEPDIEDAVKALAALEPKKMDRVVALAKKLREYNQKLKALKQGIVDDTLVDDMTDDDPLNQSAADSMGGFIET